MRLLPIVGIIACIQQCSENTSEPIFLFGKHFKFITQSDSVLAKI